MKGERQTLTTSTAVNKVLQAKGEPIRIDKAAITAPEVQAEIRPEPKITLQPTKTQAPPIKIAFTSKADILPTPKAQPEYKQPMPVKLKALEQTIAQQQAEQVKSIKLQPTKAEAPPIKSAFTRKTESQPTPKAAAEYKQAMPVKIKALEKAITERHAVKAEVPKPEERKSWFTSATEKTKPMTAAIDKAINQQKAAQPSPERPSTQTQEKFSKAQERPQRTATNSGVREKIRAEAETKRASVPPEYRAELYRPKTETPKPESKAADAFTAEPRNAFNTTAAAGNAPKAAKPRMGDTFNMKSGAQDTNQERPQLDIDNGSEVEI